jgi:hypothetical protein
MSQGKSVEAHAYTPGLKIKSYETVSKERVLPINGTVYVKEGDQVGFDTVIARSKIPGDPVMINISESLGTDPGMINDFLKKKQGDRVKKGEIIAQDKAFFGLINRFVYSPIDGQIETLSDVTGQAIIREDPIDIEVDSYIQGKITRIITGKGAEVTTNAAIIQGIFGIGGESFGELAMAVDSPSERLTPEKISTNHKDKIIVGGSFVSEDAFIKAKSVGARGIIIGGIDVEELIDIIKEDIGVAITGEEDVGLTLVVTEGFGEMPMSTRAFNLLKSLEGSRASINGTTQIRAGVIRPEIIVPYDSSKKRGGEGEHLSHGMRPGTVVRIIRDPYFGKIATVTDLPIELVKVQTESLVRVASVKLEDGTEAIIPRANLEVIEE